VRRALHYIVSQPLDWLRLLLRKTLLYWNAFEIPDNYDFAFFAERLSPLPWLPHFPAAAVLGLLGIALPARGRAAWVLQWLILVSMLSVILFYVNDRFRVVTVPFLLVAGAVALARIHEALRQRDGRTLSACLVLSALFYALTQTSVADSERARVAAFSWARYGEHLLDSGQVPEAGEALRRAYAWNKNDKYANRGLGDVYMWSKQFERAAFHYVESVRLGLDEPDLLHKTVAALVAAHRPDIAVDFVTHTLRSEPGVREPYRLPHDFGYSPSQLTDLLPREP
jgi:tetratricopeptide (TPR) repeat protein